MNEPLRDVDRDMKRLEADLKQLEAEYNMFFAGRLPTPPWETRRRVEALIKRYDRGHIQNFGDRFRFTSLQARFATFTDLWDRGLRAREEGRPGPFSPRKPAPSPDPAKADERVLHVALFSDPIKEADKLQDLYKSLVEARKEVGETAVPFQKFTELVKGQVQKLKQTGAPEVAFRVAVKNGKVSFTARGMRGTKKTDRP